MDFQDLYDWVEAAPSNQVVIAKAHLLEILDQHRSRSFSADDVDWQRVNYECRQSLGEEDDLVNFADVELELDHNNRVVVTDVQVDIDTAVENVVDTVIGYLREHHSPKD